jgi:hypothetical protein
MTIQEHGEVEKCFGALGTAQHAGRNTPATAVNGERMLRNDRVMYRKPKSALIPGTQ